MELTQLSILKQSLIGKKLKHKNQYNREVTLEVEDVTIEHGSSELEPSTRENDWWPTEETWTYWWIHFIDGSKMKFNPNQTLVIEDDAK